MSFRARRLFRAFYFGSILFLLLAILIQLPRAKDSGACASRWEGEIVALRQDSAGNFYCQRVDYSARKTQR